MKLELKHLAPYLPYGLKIEHPTMLVGKCKISELKNLGQTNIEILHRLYVQISECKPILRPILDAKNVEFSEKVKSLRFGTATYFFLHYSGQFNFKTIPYESVQFLLENHFDIFGLIDKGLAVSIHDVEQVIA